MALAAKTPVTVITGFLGAGKTSLIRHMLENANGRKLALIINEFGDLGIDGDILKGVRFFGDGARTHSLVMTNQNMKIRFIDTTHVFNKETVEYRI